MTSLKRHTRSERADMGCVIKLWNPFLRSGANAKSVCVQQLLRKSMKEKNPSRSVKYKDSGTQKFPKSNLFGS